VVVEAAAVAVAVVMAPLPLYARMAHHFIFALALVGLLSVASPTVAGFPLVVVHLVVGHSFLMVTGYPPLGYKPVLVVVVVVVVVVAVEYPQAACKLVAVAQPLLTSRIA
jgi:hypothetical protein